MVETNPNGNIKEEAEDSELEDLEAQLNEIEHALDNLESQNDNIHSKLKELLESNREIRKEMVDLGMVKTASGATSASGTSDSGVDLPPKLNEMSINEADPETSKHNQKSPKSKKN